MKEIRIKYCSGSLNWNKEKMLPTIILRKYYNVIFDDENPEYIFCNVWDKEYLKYPEAVRILWCTESVIPDFNVYDYGIGLHNITFYDRYTHLPLIGINNDGIEKLSVTERKISKEKLLSKTDFCGFVYSNQALKATVRKELFDKLSEYKKVSSGGGYLNNVGGKVDNKIEFLSNCKFSIACENAYLEGYTTEKIIDSFLADTIPIYWGNPAITEMFNKKAFINVHEYKSLDKLLEEVISLDNDDEKYFTMLNEPIFCENSLVKEKEEFVAFILNIFEQNHKEAFRRNQTGWEDWYEDRLREDIKNRDIVSKLNSIWGKIPGPIRNIIKRI